jgi:hypothetical protein
VVADGVVIGCVMKAAAKPADASSLAYGYQHADARLRTDTRGRDGRLRQELAEGVTHRCAPICFKSKLSREAEPIWRVCPCPYCHKPMKRAFTIAPSDGQAEIFVLYCASCKHVETIATTSLRPTLNQPRACRE